LSSSCFHVQIIAILAHDLLANSARTAQISKDFWDRDGSEVASAVAMEFDRSPFVEAVIGSAIEVHSHLGPGLLESAYEKCLIREFHLRGIQSQRQCQLPLNYKGAFVDCGYRVDFVVEGAVVVELKTIDRVLPIHKSQVLTYLRLLKIRHGLILNFNVQLMKEGIHSIICPIRPVPDAVTEFAE
jgi:GxxExxY protein